MSAPPPLTTAFAADVDSLRRPQTTVFVGAPHPLQHGDRRRTPRPQQIRATYPGYARRMELAGIVILALFVVAAVSIGRARHISVLMKIGWLVIVFVLPVLGPILWFAFGQRYAFRVNGEARQ